MPERYHGDNSRRWYDDDPQLEADEEVQFDEGIDPREPTEVARRAVVLLAVICAAHGAKREPLIDWLQREGLWEAASPNEKQYLRGSASDREDELNHQWRIEALQALLWSMDIIDALPPADQSADAEQVLAHLPDPLTATEAFIQAAGLRDVEVMLDMDRANYELGNQVDEAVAAGRPAPDGMLLDVLYERRCAFEWLLDRELPWDQAGEVGEVGPASETPPPDGDARESESGDAAPPSGWDGGQDHPDDDRDLPLPPGA